MAGKHEGTAPERPRKDSIATAVAGNLPQTTVAAEDGMGCGKAVGACIVDHHTAWNTTTDHPDRPGRVGERVAGGTCADSYDLGKTE